MTTTFIPPKRCINFKFLQKNSSQEMHSLLTLQFVLIKFHTLSCIFLINLIKCPNVQLVYLTVLSLAHFDDVLQIVFLTFMVTIISCNIWKIAMAKTVCTTGGRTSVSLQLWQLMKRLWSQTSRVNALMTRFQLMVPRPNPDVTKNLMGHRMHNAHRGPPNSVN